MSGLNRNRTIAMFRNAVLLPSLALLLAACSGAPDQADVASAVAHLYDEDLRSEREVLAGVGMDGLLPSLVTAEKLACATSATGRGYDCDVRLVTEQFGSRSSTVTAMRLVAGADGWYVAEAARSGQNQ